MFLVRGGNNDHVMVLVHKISSDTTLPAGSRMVDVLLNIGDNLEGRRVLYGKIFLQ